MKFKELIKQFTPPIFLQAYRRNRGIRYIWNGIYDSFATVPLAGNGSTDEEVLPEELTYANKIIAAARRDCAVPAKLVNDEAFLSLLASVVRQRHSGRLRVVDFGGYLGFGYVHLLYGAISCTHIDYHVVELERPCLEGKRLFQGDNRIHFHRTLPESLRAVDIVYSRGTLQYIEDYADLLRRLCSYRAQYVFLDWIPVGTFPTFASAQQNNQGTTFPHWFFNFDELVSLVEAERYSLVFKSAVDDRFNQDNFPPQYRLDAGNSCALLFENSEDRSPRPV